MNSPILLLAEQHQQIKLLLPWYLNRTLDEHEQQQVEKHLQSCFQCNRELLNLRQLSAAINRSADMEVAAEVSFAKLQTKIRKTPSSGQKLQLTAIGLNQSKRINTGAAHNMVNWLRQFLLSHGAQPRYVAVAVVMLLLSPLAVLTWKSTSLPEYYTLAANKGVFSGHNKLHVVFTSSLTDADKDELLAQVHASRIVGPNSVGAYTVQLDYPADSQALINAIQYLRKQPVVMLAEPITQP